MIVELIDSGLGFPLAFGIALTTTSDKACRHAGCTLVVQISTIASASCSKLKGSDCAIAANVVASTPPGPAELRRRRNDARRMTLRTAMASGAGSGLLT